MPLVFLWDSTELDLTARAQDEQVASYANRRRYIDLSMRPAYRDRTLTPADI